MHQQPVFQHCPSRLDGTSDLLFRTGLCLPSGSSLTHDDQDRVIDAILERAAGA
jgi:dTDP-4-amino-4,6-dideoxygalactose transaminase